MENIFFNSVYSNFEQTLISLLIFIALSGILIYVIYFVLSKILFKKPKKHIVKSFVNITKLDLQKIVTTFDVINGTLKFKEMVEICDILGYKIDFKKG